MMTKQEQKPTLWTAEEAAEYLHMSTKWVYRKALAEEIPCKRFGSRVRFVPSEIQAWVAAGGSGSAAGATVSVLSVAQR
jgi:excisionase family DNA binding protein